MYEVPAGGILEVRLRGLLFNQVVMNTFHYRALTTSTDGEASLLAALADFEAVVWSAIHPAITTDVNSVEIDGQWITPTRFRARTHTPTTQGGTAAGATQQTGTAAVVRRFGQEANRHNQGRIYLFGCPQEQQQEGAWKAVFMNGPLSDVKDAVKAVIQASTDDQLIPVLVNRTAPGIGVVIQGSKVDRVIRYQRRRELGVGQ